MGDFNLKSPDGDLENGPSTPESLVQFMNKKLGILTGSLDTGAEERRLRLCSAGDYLTLKVALLVISA